MQVSPSHTIDHHSLATYHIPITRMLQMLLGMLEFLLFHKNTKVKKDVSLIDGEGYRYSRESIEATEMKEEQEFRERRKSLRCISFV